MADCCVVIAEAESEGADNLLDLPVLLERRLDDGIDILQ